MKPWKSFASSGTLRLPSLLQWGHGDEAVEEMETPDTTTSEDGFNGATAMKPWKSGVTNAWSSPRTTLQWGHGDEAVEESRYSMISPLTIMALQWGHGDEAVEERFALRAS